MRILLIDGNYFAMRCLGTLNMGDNVNNLKTDEEISNFNSCMNLQFIKLWESFSNAGCDNVIFCADSFSWRKELPDYKPFYISEEEIKNGDVILGYKKQRDKIKEESEIDYDMFYKLFDKFVNDISKDVTVVRSKGLEGDDIIQLLSNRLSPKNEVIIFCTDNDLTQLSKENITIFRNIRSKKSPFGEIIISARDAQKLQQKKNPLNQSVIFEKDIDKINGDKLFSINLINDDNSAKREIDNGIVISEPYKVILNKCIIGDKSDNILPLIRWKSSTGTRNYSVTEKHIEEAFENTFEPYNENTCREYLMNKSYMDHFLKNLILVTKINEKISGDKKVTSDILMEHFIYNLRLVFLYTKLLPPSYLEEFENKYKDLKLSTKFDIENFKNKHSINLKDNASNFLERSIIL